jgi:hypothetical protein
MAGTSGKNLIDMNSNANKLNIHHLKNLLISAFFTLGILIVIGYFGELQVEQQAKAQLAEHLKTTLNSNRAMLELCSKKRERMPRSLPKI